MNESTLDLVDWSDSGKIGTLLLALATACSDEVASGNTGTESNSGATSTPGTSADGGATSSGGGSSCLDGGWGNYPLCRLPDGSTCTCPEGLTCAPATVDTAECVVCDCEPDEECFSDGVGGGYCVPWPPPTDTTTDGTGTTSTTGTGTSTVSGTGTSTTTGDGTTSGAPTTSGTTP